MPNELTTTGLTALHATFTAEGVITIHEQLTFEDWKRDLATLKIIKAKAEIIIASYVKYGQLKYGKEEVLSAMAQLEFDLPTVKAVMDIASVPDSIRKPNLTAGHYIAIARANLTPKQAEKWAKVASEQSLTENQLKNSIAQGTVVDTSVANKNSHGVLNVHGIMHEFTIWLTRMGGVPGILKMDDEHRREILAQMEEVLELGRALEQSLAMEVETANLQSSE
jgi:hypothetical protein